MHWRIGGSNNITIIILKTITVIRIITSQSVNYLSIWGVQTVSVEKLRIILHECCYDPHPALLRQHSISNLTALWHINELNDLAKGEDGARWWLIFLPQTYCCPGPGGTRPGSDFWSHLMPLGKLGILYIYIRVCVTLCYIHVQSARIGNGC